jgi:hypothetical protein
MRVENASFTDYQTTPLRLGGSINAIHVLMIDGRNHSFVAPGRRQWVFKPDTVSFDRALHEETGQHRIDPQTIVVLDCSGTPVKRGWRFSR